MSTAPGVRCRRMRRWSRFCSGYGAAIFGSLVAGFFDHTLLTYPHAVALLWFVLGMGAAAARLALQAD